MATLARKLIKFFLFVIILVIVGRSIGEPYNWVNYNLVLFFGHLIYGEGDIGAEAIDDTYFYIDFITATLIATIIYLMIMILVKNYRKVRR